MISVLRQSEVAVALAGLEMLMVPIVGAVFTVVVTVDVAVHPVELVTVKLNVTCPVEVGV
jgi:hypothetical protein